MYSETITTFDEYDSFIKNFTWNEAEIQSIVPSIDYVNISIPFGLVSSHKIHSLVSNHFEVMRTAEGEGQNKYYLAQVNLDSNWYGVHVAINYGNFRTMFQFKNPDKTYFSYIKSFLPSPNDRYACCFSDVEFTLDLYTSNNGRVFDYCSLTAALNHPGKLFTFDNQFSKTRYLNDIRANNKKGAKVYLKESIQGSPVRLETIWKQRMLKEQGITSIHQLEQMNPAIPFEHWRFQYYHWEKFEKNVENAKLDWSEFEKNFFRTIYGADNCGGVAAVKEYTRQFDKYYNKKFSNQSFRKDLLRNIKGLSFV